MELVGQILPEQTLRFNSALKYASDLRARKGVTKFGPYNSSLFRLQSNSLWRRSLMHPLIGTRISW